MKAEAQESGILTSILQETRARMSGRSLERPEWERLAARAQPAPSFAKALAGATVGLIGEVKRRSPSAGAINEGADAATLARSYADAGAAAISVLTDEKRFGGSIDDLQKVARIVGLPTLRKDFIVDPIQVLEARAVGAAAILLIARALSAEELASLAELAHKIGLATLVEVHSAGELAAAAGVNPTMIGVNARDLDTLAMDPSIPSGLLPNVPPGIIAVAESGLRTRADVERVAAAGADAVLVGAALAGAADAGSAVKALVGVSKQRAAK
ncbi:MAG TPA: indole-3-glycerol phosphate synthase TrpC [Gemmatimonadales bacterium]|jgi:indole-3-glycerol phosphate synthase